MALVPLEGELKGAEGGTLELTDRQVQQAGVRFGRVSRRALVKEINTFGEVSYDERRLSRITSWVSGRVEKLHVNFTGDRVTKGAPLADLYSPPLVVAIEQFAEAKRGVGRLEKGTPHATAVQQAKDLVASTRILLARQGLESAQIREIEERIEAGEDPLKGEAVPTVSIRSKQAGVVVEKRVEEGEYVKEGTEILRIADLSVVWVYADIYENEIPFVKEGARVSLTTRAYPGEEFTGTIGFIDPFLQRRTRTVRVRVDMPNGEGRLKPGMFARVKISHSMPDLAAVPESAVLHSGRRKIALLHEGKGRFRPRIVTLGRMWLYPAKKDPPRKDALDFALDEHDRYHEVLGGLSEGDEVVVAGGFLLAAEAQFQGLLKKLIEEPSPDQAGKEPAVDACAWDGMTMQVSGMKAVDVGGERLLFCSAEEESHYHKSPETSWHAWKRAMTSGMDKVLEAYYRIGDSLSQDRHDPEGFAELGTLANLPPSQPHFAPRALEPYQKRMDAIREAASRGKSTENIIEARRAYGLISNELVGYVRENAPDKVANREIHGFSCGMAGKMHKIPSEDWLQPKDELRNPYMGRAMFG